jgi:hypothetical protein
MPHTCSNLRQRLQNKPPQMHRRMRNRQPWPLHRSIPKKQNINVEGPRPFAQIAHPPSPRLNRKNPREHFFRTQRGVQLNHTIQKPTLLRDLDRLRLIERRNRDHLTQLAQSGDSGFQMPHPIPNIRSQRKINSSHAHKSTRANPLRCGVDVSLWFRLRSFFFSRIHGTMRKARLWADRYTPKSRRSRVKMVSMPSREAR